MTFLVLWALLMTVSQEPWVAVNLTASSGNSRAVAGLLNTASRLCHRPCTASHCSRGGERGRGERERGGRERERERGGERERERERERGGKRGRERVRKGERKKQREREREKGRK